MLWLGRDFEKRKINMGTVFICVRFGVPACEDIDTDCSAVF